MYVCKTGCQADTGLQLRWSHCFSRLQDFIQSNSYSKEDRCVIVYESQVLEEGVLGQCCIKEARHSLKVRKQAC